MKRNEIVAGFLIRILMGCLYGYIYLHYYHGDDTWKMFHASLQETRLLLEHPRTFFTNEFTPLHALQEGNGWKDVIRLYIIDLQYALMVKSMAFVNIISGSNYYVNMIVFNIVAFFGQYWFFKTMISYFPYARRLLYISVFLFLPAVFWLSGYRIEGLLFFFLALFLYHLLVKKKATGIVVGFIGMLVCRPEIAGFVAIGAIAWLLSNKYGKSAIWFAGTLVVGLIIFFGSPLPAAVAQKQREFFGLTGTRFALDTLQPSVPSFAKVFPQAVVNTYFRPYPWEANGALQMMAAGEILLFWSIVFFAIFNRQQNWRQLLRHPVLWYLLTLAGCIYLSIGYIVPFPGAIIRYKSIAELIFIACTAVLIKEHFILRNK